MKNKPPFCPNMDCSNHNVPEGDWYIKCGHYYAEAYGYVQRYCCKECGKYFSDQTFNVSYYLQRKIPLNNLVSAVKSGEGIRNIARNYKIAPCAIINRIGRLARQFIGMALELRDEHILNEDLVADGFESFTVSQYFPDNYHLLVGKESQFLYALDYAHLRRKGCMTNKQLKKRAELEKKFLPAHKEINLSFERLCVRVRDLFLSNQTQKWTIFTDKKKEYKEVLDLMKEHDFEGGGDEPFYHKTVSSRDPRDGDNPLFAVNYFDREIRKDMANHTRETVQWSRDTNNALERMNLYCGYHNFLKPYRISPLDKRSHAEVAGFDSSEINRHLKHLFTRRYFLSKLHCTPSEILMWLRGFATPLSKEKRRTPAYVLS